jgi:hypothetical protein
MDRQSRAVRAITRINGFRVISQRAISEVSNTAHTPLPPLSYKQPQHPFTGNARRPRQSMAPGKAIATWICSNLRPRFSLLKTK